MTYPLPSYAASIWLEGDTVWLGLPGETRGHSVPVPATVEGLAQVLRILASREKAQRATIGTDAAPTRHMIEQAIARREKFRREREAKAEAKATPKPSIDDTLRELGLI